MDQTLDEIVSERHRGSGRGRRGGGGRRNDRNDYPRDGIRKTTRDEPRNLDSEWVHDKYDDNAGPDSRRPARPSRRHSPEQASSDYGSTKLRVENLHYDLTEEDLDDLFTRIGPVEKLELLYDRAGRSNGIAYVTYVSAADAKRAILDFDGANANGQPIRLVSMPSGPGGGGRSRNPFDTAIRPSRPLAERITAPGGRRSRSRSPVRRTDVSGPAPANVDRYVPGGGRRSRSPIRRRRDGRPPGQRRERGDKGGRGREGGGGAGGGGGRRPKKTQEELDAEMDDYWGGGSKENGASESNGVADSAAAPASMEVDMEEL